MHPCAPALVSRVVLSLAFLLPCVTQAEPTSRRHVVLSEFPAGQMAEIRIAADVPTMVCFESELDPAGTRLLEPGSSPFESLDVSGRVLLLHPSVGAWLWPRMTLQVRLVDGTSLTLVLVPSPPALADVQVDVFLHPFTPGALRAALEKVRAEYQALQFEHARSQAELARYRDDEFNPDVAIAVLLLDDEASRHLLKEKPLEVETVTIAARAWFVRLAGRSAYVFLVTNRHRTVNWTLMDAAILQDSTREPLPVVVRVRPTIIPPGASGRVVIVTRTPASANKEVYVVRLQGPEGPNGLLCYSGARL